MQDDSFIQNAHTELIGFFCIKKSQRKGIYEVCVRATHSERQGKRHAGALFRRMTGVLTGTGGIWGWNGKRISKGNEQSVQRSGYPASRSHGILIIP